MKRTILSAVKVGGEGIVVNFNGNAADCIEAVSMALASAVANLAKDGMPVESIARMITDCVDYGMKCGLEWAKEVRQ